jgi:hypothetical protein
VTFRTLDSDGLAQIEPVPLNQRLNCLMCGFSSHNLA